MKIVSKIISIVLIAITLLGCKNEKSTLVKKESTVRIVSAMKNVMWNGALDGTILLDTISNKKALYGLGPKSYLTGELLINDGKSFVSKVVSDSTMQVKESWEVSAPFFVYTTNEEWKEIELPESCKSISDLEKFINERSKENSKPFVFKLIGKVAKAQIHIQNLPLGTKVSSPKEAHQGQVNYNLLNEEVEIIGFFSRQHQGIFTHHDSYLHMHLITKDLSKMGHLDSIEISELKLYLPI